ncbi:HIT family protein [endosymbiont GvMRE of Glomus versiforme]|uniref:HIT family protein n=1 Tax=endosymbiont GvMRE of Glomus versiforme TaxID=2039283 RepID=UPI000EDF0601|nr:HIT family protein [endosymbiont GvMRE of Glomus versiforme]RHZ37181.1 Protein hit [endosymbiont GvMRE of Glomus versiforme]
MSNCPFCQIIKGEISAHIVAKDEKNKCLAFLDINPNSKGHTLIISTKVKEHAKNITELEEEDWNSILPLLKKVVEKLQNVFKPQGFNFITNMGEEAYQSVFHFHLHIIPKYGKKEEEKGFVWKVQKEKSIDLVTQAANKLKIELTKLN